MTRKESVTRIRIILAVILVFAVFVALRLYFVQIIHGEDFSDRADRQYVRDVRDIFDRGFIYFQSRNGTPIRAATLKSGYVLTMNPTLLVNPEEVHTTLRSVIDIDKEDFLRRAEKKDDPYEEVAHRIDEETAQKIEALELEGVRLYRERWRHYPGGSLASHALGIIGFQEHVLAGRYGVERYWDTTLQRSNRNLYVNFFAQVFGGFAETIGKAQGSEGGNVYLTVEPTVQGELEKQLARVLQDYSPSQVGGIIMDPATGEIVAMAALPNFDPNRLDSIERVSVLSNPLVENVYEMGSIIKPLTMAAGIDAGAVTPETTYVDRGTIEVGDRTISNFDEKARGRVSMQEVLNQSLNTGVAFVVRQMGNEKFADYFRAFGFGEKTGIDLPNEASGLIENLESPRDVEYATASFGQGVAISPIQTVRALAALANGGTLVTPHVADKIRYETGISRQIEHEEGRRVIAPETSEEVTRMLVKVVDEALAGGTVALPRYSVAAKTGTAEIPAPDGGYYDDRVLHSFFGYVPAYDPEYLIFLLNIEPVGARYASETLTDPFMDLTTFLINYYEIPPDR